MNQKQKNSRQKKAAQILTTVITFGLTTVAQADFGIVANAANNNDYKNPDDDISLLLGVEYRGEKFNVSHGVISYDFSHSKKYGVEALLASKNIGYDAKDSKTFTGMDDRDVSIDVGGRLIIDTGALPVTFDVSKDINSSKGYDAGLKVGGIAPHASHWNGKRELKVMAAGGLRYQSKDVVDYYYGVKNSEATANRHAYKGKSALTPYVGVEAQANITKHFTINADLGVERRANSIINSPLTTDKEYQGIANIGITYWF